MMQAIDILILSNGPGELATWVLPVARALRENLRDKLGNDSSQVRISLILSPCPHATGKETEIARSYPEIDRVQAPEYFWNFLFWGKTQEKWDWREKGAVIFLGGDQFFTLAIGKRLGYRTIVYAEWEARWHSWIDRFGVMKPEIISNFPQKFAHKFTVVGDLMAEVGNQKNYINTGELVNSETEIIALLVGSKPAKLAQGVPLCLAIAEYIHQKRSHTKFIIPLAATLDLATLARFADSQQNPISKLFNQTGGNIKYNQFQTPYLETYNGLQVEIHTKTPAYDILSQCCICITTVGANTAELGALSIPMIVLLPTQQLDAMRAWDGLPGLLANLPGIGSIFAKLINLLVLRQGRLFAWPNIWAKSEIVPELVGKLQPETVGEIVLDYLNHPEKLADMQEKLKAVRGKTGAAKKLAEIIWEEINLGMTE